MNLDVKNLVVAPFGQKESFSLEYFNEQIDEEILAERARGKLDLTRLQDEILADFNGNARVKMTCDRCLTEYCLEIPLKFKSEFLLGQEPAEEEKFRVTKQFEIDFWEPLRQEIGSRIPVKKLCHGDCKGLCANCGQNLNAGVCKCRKAKSH